MVEHSINIQQLPLTMLKEIINELYVEDIITLIHTNKYFNSITTPILYDSVIYDHDFSDAKYDLEDININEIELTQNDGSKPLNNKLDESEKEAELNENEKENSLAVLLRDKLWSNVAPSIKKYNQYIEMAQAINPDNLYNELESYSKLKRYRLNIDTQEGIDQLTNYTGTKFIYMERLELEVEPSLDFEVQDLFPHFAHLKGLELKLNLYQFNIDWLTCFKSNNLTYINVEDYEVSTKFFQIVHQNFIHLKYLDFKFYYLNWDEDITDLPTFKDIIDLKFTIYQKCEPEVLAYLTDIKYWPSLKSLDAFNDKNDDPVIFDNHRDGLLSLYISIIDPYNLNQWGNLTELQVLYLDLNNQFSLDLLQTIFMKLTNLSRLELSGDILSEYFAFQPKIQLRCLKIRKLNNFSLPFVEFIRSHPSLRKIELLFTENSFVGVDWDKILAGEHTFPNLRTITLSDAPVILENWFIDNSKVLTKVQRYKKCHFQERIFL